MKEVVIVKEKRGQVFTNEIKKPRRLFSTLPYPIRPQPHNLSAPTLLHNINADLRTTLHEIRRRRRLCPWQIARSAIVKRADDGTDWL